MLKTAVFLVIFLGVVPAGTILARMSPAVKKWVFMLTVFSTIRFLALHIAPDPDWTGTARGYAVTFTDIFSLILFLSEVRESGWKTFLCPPGMFFYLLYCVCGILSFSVSAYKFYSGMELFKMFWMYLAFTAVFNYLYRLRDLWPLFNALVAALGVMFVYGVWQKYFGGIYQVMSTMPHQNSMTMFCSLAGCFMLGVLLNEKCTGIRLAAACAAAGSAGLLVVFSFSRGGMFCLGLGFFIVTAVSVAFGGFSGKKAVVVLLMAAGGIAVLAVAAPRIIQRFNNAPESSKMTRVYLARAAVRIANDHPFGTGVNTFSRYSSPDAGYASEMYENGVPADNDGSHGGIVETCYLLTAAECGWYGLGIYLLWFVAYLILGFRCVLAYRGSPGFGAAAGIFGGLCANDIQSSLEWVLKQYQNFYLMMIMFAVLGVLWALRPNASRGGKRRERHA